jgi:hypothetical protein
MAATVVDKFKVWLFPTLISVISMFIWQEIKEVKADVKELLAQSNIDKTRIDNLERAVFHTTTSQNTPDPTKKNDTFYRDLYVLSYDSKKQAYVKQTNGSTR